MREILKKAVCENCKAEYTVRENDFFCMECASVLKDTGVRITVEDPKKLRNMVGQTKEAQLASAKKEKEFKTAKKKDKAFFASCRRWVFIGIIILLVSAFVGMQFGAHIWVEQVLIPEAGFDTFFALFNSYGGENAGYEIGILAVVLEGLMWLIILIWAVKNGEGKTWFGILFGGMFLAALPIVLPFLAIRLALVGLSWVAYFLLQPYGLIAFTALVALILLIKCRKLKLGRSIIKLIICVILVVAVGIVSVFFGSQYYDKAIEAHDYFAGTSFQDAEVLDCEDDKHTVFINQTIEVKRAYYFTFTPTTTAEYLIRATGNDSYAGGAVYSASLDKIEDSSDLLIYPIERTFEANQTYYIKVYLSNGEDKVGHFTVHISFANLLNVA